MMTFYMRLNVDVYRSKVLVYRFHLSFDSFLDLLNYSYVDFLELKAKVVVTYSTNN